MIKPTAEDTVMGMDEINYIRNSTVARDMADNARNEGYKAGKEEGIGCMCKPFELHGEVWYRQGKREGAEGVLMRLIPHYNPIFLSGKKRGETLDGIHEKNPSEHWKFPVEVCEVMAIRRELGMPESW